jgi:competence protein ComFC
MNLIDLIFPKKCFGCSRQGEYFCGDCLEKLHPKNQNCPVCIKPSIDGMTHSKCRRRLSLNGHYSFWSYRGAVRRVILAMKYKFAFDIARELAGKASRILDKEIVFGRHVVLIPIPSHHLRQNWRGFNQSEEVGKLIAKNMGWRYGPNLLIKSRSTLPQTELGRRSRLKNLRRAFALNPNYLLVPNAYPIVLFDDVWTTGATIKEACKELKRSGFTNVWGLTLAS